MDDVNINKICLEIEEVELDGDDKEWIKLSWISGQSDDDEKFQSPKTHRDLDNEIAQMKDCDNKVSLTSTETNTNMELEDVSDGISVITDSDTDAANTNLFPVCQFKPFESPQILEVQTNRQELNLFIKKDMWNILIATVLGIIIGLALSHLFTSSEACPVSGTVDAESLRTASHDIVNTCKELTDVKTMLNEIKTYIPIDKKIAKQFLIQFSDITDSSDETSGKPIRKEPFKSTSHPLDHLQESLYVLSSLAFIYDNDSSLKNEISKTLDIVNNTKVFYDTLILISNDTQDEFNPIVLKLLQHNSNEMHTTSKLFLSKLVEKVNKVTSNLYNKYAKERDRLNKKLCHLKSILPDDKLLKQLTENNRMLKDYDKSCLSNYTKNSDGRTIVKENTKIKEKITKTDNTVLHPKHDKKNNHIIHDNNRENSWKNERNKRQNVDKSILKSLRNGHHKIHKDSQFFSEVVENINELRLQLNKKLHHLKDILPNNNEFLKQLIKDDEENNKESIKCCEGKDDYLQSNTLKNSFDDILMQLKNTCPLSTNYCPEFNINTSTFDSVSNHKTKNYKHKKYTDNKKTEDYGNSVKTLPVEEESRSKRKQTKKDHFKSNGSIKKDINDKTNYEEKDISSQNKIKDRISDTINYHKSKHSLFDSRTIEQDNQYYTNTDRKSDNKRFNEYKKQQQFDDSNWYFRRAFSRRNARKHAVYIYQQNTKWKNHR